MESIPIIGEQKLKYGMAIIQSTEPSLRAYLFKNKVNWFLKLVARIMGSCSLGRFREKSSPRFESFFLSYCKIHGYTIYPVSHHNPNPTSSARCEKCQREDLSRLKKPYLGPSEPIASPPDRRAG